MRPLRRVAAALASLAVFPAQAVQILVPADRAAVTGDSLLIVGTAPRGTEVAWTAEGPRGPERGEVRADWGDLFELFLLLDPGVTRITVGDRSLQVFLGRPGEPPPPGFGPLRVHAGDVSRCDDCHRPEGAGLRAGGYPGACLGCHVVESQAPGRPGPPGDDPHFRAAVADCGRCHAAHAATRAGLLRAAVPDLCGACHPGTPARAGTHLAQGCTACHDPHFSGYARGLHEPLPGLCHRCHPEGRGIPSSPRHPPPGRGEACVACHPPHGRGTRAPGSCRGCHPAATDRGHGLRLAECLGCHDPHLAPGGGLLSRSAQDRCVACHPEVTPGPAAHPALARGCERCHDPHREDDRTRAWGACTGCHAPGLHGGLPMPAASCGTCHRPHAGRAAGLLRARPHSPVARGKCAVCHGGGQDRSLVVRDPAARCRMCHAVEKDLRTPGVRAHAPVARGECTACHDPHLSDQPALLRAPGNGACRGCHPLAGHHPLDTRRAGQYPGAQGFLSAGEQFACLGCHAPHGSAVPGLLVRPREELCRTCHPGRP